MLSRNLGGIQQSFLDYDTALRLQNYDVINITSNFAKINNFINSNSKLINIAPWDILSCLYLKYLIRTLKIDIIIAHGNRAICFAKMAKPKSSILIGVAHNYTLKGLKKCNYIIALTQDMKSYLEAHNFRSSHICIIPNMLNIKKDFIRERNYRNPIIIGTIARFVPKKSIDIFLMSLEILKKQEYNFKAIIGGDGKDKEKLFNLSKNLGLDSYVSFTGWVRNKEKFFNDIDIFCLPSEHEPFGIILLEAMESSIPIITTNTEGPREIIINKKTGLFCKINSPSSLTKEIIYLMNNHNMACKYAESAYIRLKEHYNINVVSLNLSKFINSIRQANH